MKSVLPVRHHANDLNHSVDAIHVKNSVSDIFFAFLLPFFFYPPPFHGFGNESTTHSAAKKERKKVVMQRTSFIFIQSNQREEIISEASTVTPISPGTGRRRSERKLKQPGFSIGGVLAREVKGGQIRELEG